MSKIILEFDGIEEASEAKDALDGYKWKLAMQNIDQELRKTTKYAQSILPDKNSTASDEEIEIAQKYRELIIDTLYEYGLSLNE
jgi:hypothetical protein